MTRTRSLLAAALLGGTLLAGCDDNEPATGTTTPDVSVDDLTTPEEAAELAADGDKVSAAIEACTGQGIDPLPEQMTAFTNQRRGWDCLTEELGTSQLVLDNVGAMTAGGREAGATHILSDGVYYWWTPTAYGFDTGPDGLNFAVSVTSEAWFPDGTGVPDDALVE